MTISVDGHFLGALGLGQTYAIDTDWSDRDQQGSGRMSLVIMNPSSRFADEINQKLTLLTGRPTIPFQGTVSGTVKQLGAPVARVVRIYRRSDGQMAGETISDAGDGSYSFSNLDETEMYFVLSFDDLGSPPDFNAIVYDQVEPG